MKRVIGLVVLCIFFIEGCSTWRTELSMSNGIGPVRVDGKIIPLSPLHSGANGIQQEEQRAILNRIDSLISQYDDYATRENLVQPRGYWRVEATVKYNEGYTTPLEVVYSFTGRALPQPHEKFLLFYSGGVLAFDTYFSFMERLSSEWKFSALGGVQTLVYKNGASEMSLRASGAESLILDWANEEGAMRTIFKRFKLNDALIELSKWDVERRLATAGNYDRDSATELIVGGWKLHSDLLYSQNWKELISPIMYNHIATWIGYSGDSFELSVDGSFVRHYELEVPLDGGDNCSVEERGEWRFDPETEELIFTGEYSGRFKIVALTEDYFIGDYFDRINKEYHRVIYERASF